MLSIIFIMVGGGLGAVFRHSVFLLVQNSLGAAFPYGTMSVNLIGSFLIGLMWCLLEGAKISPELRFFIFTGFLGGFTTFSTFARETTQLFKVGEWKTALLYASASNILGVLLVFAGYAIARYLLTAIKG